MKNKKNIILTAAILIAVALISACGKKEEYRLIKIDEITGDVEIKRATTDKELSGRPGMLLVNLDKVCVEDNSELLLLVDSDKHLYTDEKTVFELQASGSSEDGKININILEGSTLISIDNKLPQNSSFSIETPNALLAVRGTVFKVTYDKDTNVTSLEVTEGVVSVEYKDGRDSKEVGAGSSIKISDDGDDFYDGDFMSDEDVADEKNIDLSNLSPSEATAKRLDLYEETFNNLSTFLLDNVSFASKDINEPMTTEALVDELSSINLYYCDYDLDDENEIILIYYGQRRRGDNIVFFDIKNLNEGVYVFDTYEAAEDDDEYDNNDYEIVNKAGAWSFGNIFLSDDGVMLYTQACDGTQCLYKLNASSYINYELITTYDPYDEEEYWEIYDEEWGNGETKKSMTAYYLDILGIEVEDYDNYIRGSLRDISGWFKSLRNYEKYY